MVGAGSEQGRGVAGAYLVDKLSRALLRMEEVTEHTVGGFCLERCRDLGTLRGSAKVCFTHNTRVVVSNCTPDYS